MLTARLALLVWASFIHFAGIYLIINGLLLIRVPISDHSTCTQNLCSLKPTHKRAVIIAIDSLRFDFIAPDPPKPLSPYYHNVLTIPRDLTARHPEHSFIFNAYADPPASTLQRIKALTTGSLPTFVDMSNTFDVDSLAEDSILTQLKLAGKKAAFMGDDTWLYIFPTSFQPNMSFPFDAFNIEDIHDGDNEIINHLFPLLTDPGKLFDLLIAHFPGVDHIGHRIGPDNPNMRSKLEQMNDVLMHIVEVLDDETLLVLLGDHGMDRAGEHVGGSGTLETSTALWIYSKGPALASPGFSIPSELLPNTTFPNAPTSHRAVQQIDLLPTLALLLGLPIPYSNLGTIIPELFSRPILDPTVSLNRGTQYMTYLDQSLTLNAMQIHRYLSTYRASQTGRELDKVWSDLEEAWNTVLNTSEGYQKLLSLARYTHAALSACRTIWMQFDETLLLLGVALLLVGLLASISAFLELSHSAVTTYKKDWSFMRRAGTGSMIGLLIAFSTSKYFPTIRLRDWALFLSSFGSCLPFLSLPQLSSLRPTTLFRLYAPFLVSTLHASVFLSTSLTVWEFRMATILLLSSLIPYLLKAIKTPVHRKPILLSLSVILACTRMISTTTVCREEQRLNCQVTFFTSGAQPPRWALLLSFPSALAISYAVRHKIRATKSEGGIARFFDPAVIMPTLTLGTVCWVLEYVDTLWMGGDWSSSLRLARTWIARGAMLLTGIAGVNWFLVPVCMETTARLPSFPKKSSYEGKQEGERRDQDIAVMMNKNIIGAPYLLFWTLALAVVWMASQLSGQVVLAAFGVGMLALFDVLVGSETIASFDAEPSSASIQTLATLKAKRSLTQRNTAPSTTPIHFMEITPLALLGLLSYFGTGHEATFTSIRWKTAFVLIPTFEYPLAHLTVILNTFGAFFLVGMGAVLLGLWNRSSVYVSFEDGDRKLVRDNWGKTDPTEGAKRQATAFGLGMMIYYHFVLLGTAVGAAVHRNDSMAWSVFIPRFMIGVASCVTVDVGVLIGVGVGVERVSKGVITGLGFK